MINAVETKLCFGFTDKEDPGEEKVFRKASVIKGLNEPLVKH